MSSTLDAARVGGCNMIRIHIYVYIFTGTKRERKKERKKERLRDRFIALAVETGGNLVFFTLVIL